MTYRILLFASIRDRVGQPTFEIASPEPLTVSQLRNRLVAAHPRLANTPVLIAINRQFGGEEDLIPAEAEIACFPPVSGG